MRICVLGTWHLGSVIAACVAEHFDTVAYDPDPSTVAGLQSGRPPIFEPGLAELVQEGLCKGRLAFSNEIAAAVGGADIVWVAFDTPVNHEDVADVNFVSRQLASAFPHLGEGAVVLVSSQVPVGFTAASEAAFCAAHPGRQVSFAYSPENLRLGTALDSFRRPQRIVAGVRNEAGRDPLTAVLSRFCDHLEWMSVESAEMTKHALNAFLANSIAFINEIAGISELVGADAKEVERGLKTDVRIGPRSYLGPGGPFAGGTLARDVVFLAQLGERTGSPAILLKAVYASNQAHKEWSRRKLMQLLGEVRGKTVAVLGLTYKPGTDTLRRSAAVELCNWLAGQGAVVRAHDPAVRQLPAELKEIVRLFDSPRDAFRDADALVVATEWPEFRNLPAKDLVGLMRTAIVIDANRFLNAETRTSQGIVYAAVGQPTKGIER